MNPELRWQRIEELFQAAVKMSAGKRKPFLKRSCADDPDICNEVKSLIASYEQSADFLETPCLESSSSILKEKPEFSLIGKMIGSYKIIKELGSGGMGIVYLAERADEQYQKQAAVKLLKSRYVAKETFKRFLSERQILANLQHSNIAQLLDGGVTEENRPYIVMEYIKGTPLLEYCDERRLTTEERLPLFRKVCSAVQFAHQNLIVHRDLKPGNILVTKDGNPKLLDFGIAKILSPALPEQSGYLTATGERLMTPEYASPEQIRGEPVTTISDVYSLGVILYELLSGHHPYSLTNYSRYETERIICEEEPQKPSRIVARMEEKPTPDGVIEITPEIVSSARKIRPESLMRRLSGDLDNIVLMAMCKEPAQRYNSAEQLSEDISRHLRGMPVLARKPTAVYRSIKFFKRNKIAVFTTSLVFLSLMIGLTVALWQNQLAREQRDLALRSANTMVFELARGLGNMPGPTENRLGLLTQAGKIFDEISNSGLSTHELERQQADAARVIAQTYRILGDSKEALVRARIAEKQARILATKKEAGVEDQIILSAVLVEFGDVLFANGNNSEALSAYNESIKLTQELDNNLKAQRWLYAALLRKGDQLYYSSKLDSAAPYYHRAFEISDSFLKRNDQDPEYFKLHATSVERLADILYYSGKVGESCPKYRKALELRKKAADLAPQNVNMLRSLAIAMQNVGWCEEQENNFDEAVSLYEESIAILYRLHNNDPSNTILATALMGGIGTLANIFHLEGNYDKAIQRYNQAINIGKKYRARGLKEIRIDKKTADISQLLSGLLIETNRYHDAKELITNTSRLLEELPENTDNRRSLASVLMRKGDLLAGQDSLYKALSEYKRALSIRQSVAGISEMSTDRQLVAFTYYKLGIAYKRLLNTAQARNALSKAKQILDNLKDSGKLSPASDGFRTYLPAVTKALNDITSQN